MEYTGLTTDTLDVVLVDSSSLLLKLILVQEEPLKLFILTQ